MINPVQLMSQPIAPVKKGIVTSFSQSFVSMCDASAPAAGLDMPEPVEGKLPRRTSRRGSLRRRQGDLAALAARVIRAVARCVALLRAERHQKPLHLAT